MGFSLPSVKRQCPNKDVLGEAACEHRGECDNPCHDALPFECEWTYYHQSRGGPVLMVHAAPFDPDRAWKATKLASGDGQ